MGAGLGLGLCLLRVLGGSWGGIRLAFALREQWRGKAILGLCA